MKRNRDTVAEMTTKRIAAARICIPWPITDHAVTYDHSLRWHPPRARCRKTIGAASLVSLIAIAIWLIISGTSVAQSLPDDEMFDPVKVISGIQITPSACEDMERRQTAVWVSIDGRGYCLRYYAAGLKLDGPNPLVAAWMSGDIMGGPNGVRH